MKIGLVSDSHGDTMALDMMLQTPEGAEAECWLHAGDFVRDAEYLEMVSGKKVYMVAGNGDWPYSKAPDDLLVELAGHKILLTHGHEHGVRYDTSTLAQNAANMGADMAVYGHTHIVDITPPGKPGVLVLNPGSIARPRDEAFGSFMLVELEKGREPKVKLIRLKDANARRFY